MKNEHYGLMIAGVGILLWGADEATSSPPFSSPPGTYAGKVYGAGGVLNGALSLPIDPTLLIVGVGLALWAWQKYGK